MDESIDARQTERVLSHLARLKHHCGQEESNVLESLRPAWLGVVAWDIVLDDLEAERYKKRASAVRLQLVSG
ncbi:MAG: hypothetical protein ACREPK_01050 [Rhodanobacteraceae bacterium]